MQIFVFFVHFVAQIVNDAQRSHDHFARGEGRQRGHADAPVPAQRLHRRLDEVSHAPKYAVAQIFALLKFVELVDLLLQCFAR